MEDVSKQWNPDICIYHANCADGFGAAWAVWKMWPDIDCIAAAYGDAPPPDILGKDILIVDFSYPAATLLDMAVGANSIVILDHHRSAEKELAGFAPFYGHKGDVVRALHTARGQASNVLVNFDQDRSGAIMAWQFAHPGVRAPELLLYVQDRDLWRFELEDSREINAYISTIDHDFDDWSNFNSYDNNERTGAAILRLQRKNLESLLDASTRKMTIGGHSVPVANVPFYMASDAGNVLSEGNSFAATYFDRADGQRQFSLRSHPDGLDVSDIAKLYGGGGHKHAAGFTCPIGWEGELPDAE